MKLQSESALGILGHFLKWEKISPNKVFLRQPIGRSWVAYSWKEVGEKARKINASLQALQLPQGSRIGLLSQNCAEWIICDLAIMMGGYVSVPFYSNVNAQTFTEILSHSETKLLFIGKMFQKDWDNLASHIPDSVRAVTMEGFDKISITDWQTFIGSTDQKGQLIVPSLDNTITIIYTSGTTGLPKGVVHTFGSTIKAVEVASNPAVLDQAGNRFFSYLPLSHAAERGLVEFGAIFSGGTIYFLDSQDEFLSTLQKTSPTHFLGVPRIWEKFQSRILQRISQKRIDTLLSYPVARSLLRAVVKRRLGLHQTKAVFSGAAFISPALIEWFIQFDIHIQEAYGMTENFNVCALNPGKQIKVGTVGKPYPNQELIIDPITSEVLQRCDWQMKGYFRNPQLTNEAVKNGFLHTGDTGELTSDGYLRLTGRLKDMFKTSKGEYIMPIDAEQQFSALLEIDQACMLGSNYPQPFLILVLSALGKTTIKTTLAEKLARTLESYNKGKMDYQRIKKVIIVREEWTNENQLLTPTLKIKRHALSVKYEHVLEKLYHTEEMVSYQ